jgi:hypothetical protein
MSDTTNEFIDFSDMELQRLRTSCNDVLKSVVECLRDRPNMYAAIRRMMTSDNIERSLTEIPDAELRQQILQASVASMVNLQSVAAIDAEIERRAGRNR